MCDVYQLRLTTFYAQEHTDTGRGFEILISDEIPALMYANIESRHMSAKQYRCWVSFCDCKCKAETELLGCAAMLHVSLLWATSGFNEGSLKQDHMTSLPS